MRLFLLPISTRRTLIYCERVAQDAAAPRGYLDRIVNKASTTWSSWETKDKGWKKTVVTYGNKALRRIPFEEWGLKTVPALTDKEKALWQDGQSKLDVLFPALYLEEKRVPEILKALATGRQALHRKRMWASIVGMPISAPFGLVPLVPNIPFFYLCFRAYSHWKALSGAKHLEFVLHHSAIRPLPSRELDEAYTAGLVARTREASRAAPTPTQADGEKVAKLVQEQSSGGSQDVMLLQGWNGKLIAERFNLPEMEIEIERAVEQVEGSIKAEEQLAGGGEKRD